MVERSSIRGESPPKLDKLVPNTVNVLKYPLVAMFFNMLGYMLYMVVFTDCNLFGKEGSKSMVQCGVDRPAVYASFIYMPCMLHILRTYHALIPQGFRFSAESVGLHLPLAPSLPIAKAPHG